MNAPKVIIIDDEHLAREIIKNYLKDKDIEIVAECPNGFEGYKAIVDKSPDIVFLDIQMPKLTGFEMLELLEQPYNIIFTTAYDEFAIKAFEVNAIDYLLKPFSKERFDSALSKAIKNMPPENGVEQKYSELEVHTQTNDQFIDRIIVKKNGTIIVLPIEEVLYLEAQDDYVNVISEKGNFLKQKRMKYYEDNLPENGFVRIHRSFIINLNFLSEIFLKEKASYYARLKNNTELPVSRSGYNKLKELLK